MRGGLTAALARDPLQAAVDARLDARLDRTRRTPVALGLSGGGDSLALLHLAADWCGRAGRPLLALTIDHRLQVGSAGWTARAGRMAASAGARWAALAWAGPKPSAGLPAAARAVRHARLAEAAREAGAAVLLLAHTADDHAETEALRAGPAPGIGRLREWAPSPAWPQGRGVMLLRPLLQVGRGELRAWLGARGLAGLDDPANADPRFARARVRAAGPPPAPPAPDDPPGFGDVLADGRLSLAREALTSDVAARRTLAAALACASGAPGGPRGRALAALRARAAEGARFTATLGGARVDADGAAVVLGRELGRSPPADAAVPPGGAVVWDGRVEAVAAEPGWSVGAAHGRLAQLSRADRARLGELPPPARGAHPAWLRGGEVRLLADGAALRSLAPARFDAAVGRIRREADLPRLTAHAARLRTTPSA